MSSSSSSSSALSLFTKRRRAYVACANCRKRKIKVGTSTYIPRFQSLGSTNPSLSPQCITVSEVDYSPCTQCALKGLKCEYSAVPDDRPSSPPEIDVPTRERNYSDEPLPITPPSAGISEYLGSTSNSSSSRGAHRSNAPPARGSPRYPYQRRRTPPGVRAAPSKLQTSRIPPQQSSSAYTAEALPPLAPQYYPDDTSYVAPLTAGYDTNFFYNQNLGQGYLPQAPGYMPQAPAYGHQAPGSGTAYPWPEAIQCICPPGPCYCGANFNC
ncbi:hypothetical protein B0H19DRAFT_1259726 [Mycena capillaripes]|nr:hypothetical protein B0H19DRAFT_1259726 [Mycena capillaripes]